MAIDEGYKSAYRQGYSDAMRDFRKKQEPTTKNDLGVDCISRQAVLELIADYDLSMGQVVKGIHALPSVTPREPVEPYKDCDTCAYSDEEDGSNCYECIKGMRK